MCHNISELSSANYSKAVKKKLKPQYNINSYQNISKMLIVSLFSFDLNITLDNGNKPQFQF